MHLFVSDDTDLPRLREVLLQLPSDAYGQAFVETDSAHHEELERPPGIMVTWLLRQPEDGSPAPAEGAHAAVAAGGWASEWMMASAAPTYEPRVWVGTSVRASVQMLIERDGCPCQHHQGFAHRMRRGFRQGPDSA